MSTVLLVDDDPLTIDVFALILRAKAPDCGVLKAANGRQAIDFLKKYPANAILTDLSMPEIDGYGVIKFRNKHRPGLPIVVMTCDMSPGVLERLHRLGVTECFEKPFDHQTVAHDLLKHLRREQMPLRPAAVP